LIESLNALDIALFWRLNRDAASPLLDGLMLLVSARLTWVLVALAILCWGLWRRDRALLHLCLLVALTLGASDLFTYQVLKSGFARERPCHQLKDVRLVEPSCGGDYGLPSNHAANSMATAVAVSLYTRRRRVAAGFFLGALLVGYSRIYVGVHFPGDVVVGFAAGALVGFAVYRLYRAVYGALGWPLPVIGRPTDRTPR
jgi:undecaprenyl-diphosphatase